MQARFLIIYGRNLSIAERLLSLIDKNQISNAADSNLSKGRVICTITAVYIHDFKQL
jgi:predicted RNA binding protein with dsRBD fold (UPF0201 family)